MGPKAIMNDSISYGHSQYFQRSHGTPQNVNSEGFIILKCNTFFRNSVGGSSLVNLGQRNDIIAISLRITYRNVFEHGEICPKWTVLQKSGSK